MRILMFLSIVLYVSEAAAESAIRVSCHEVDKGAQVLINGHLKGDCPIDIKVAPGISKIKVQRPVGKRSQLYKELETQLGDGVVKKVEVPRLEYVEDKMSVLEAEAKSGNGMAMMNLGYVYGEGSSVPKDESKSIAWYRASALSLRKAADEKTDTNAMQALGFMYFRGTGVEKSDPKGAAWYVKAAEAGDPRAMMELGSLFSLGKGVEKSAQQSMAWKQKAIEAARKNATSGNAESMYDLGSFLFDMGKAGENDKEAVSWYRKSAEAGNWKGMEGYAGMLKGGLGVAEDANAALVWRQRAAAVKIRDW